MYELFAPYGAIRSVKVLTDDSGKCKGVGFANFAHYNDAQTAIAAVNNTKPPQCELPLLVSMQQPRK